VTQFESALSTTNGRVSDLGQVCVDDELDSKIQSDEEEDTQAIENDVYEIQRDCILHESRNSIAEVLGYRSDDAADVNDVNDYMKGNGRSNHDSERKATAVQ
jgi:hypothetical protein